MLRLGNLDLDFKIWISDFPIYYTNFEIISDPCNLIGSQQCDLFTNCTIFCSKSYHFLANQNENEIILSITFHGFPALANQIAEKYNAKKVIWGGGGFCNFGFTSV